MKRESWNTKAIVGADNIESLSHCFIFRFIVKLTRCGSNMMSISDSIFKVKPAVVNTDKGCTTILTVHFWFSDQPTHTTQHLSKSLKALRG